VYAAKGLFEIDEVNCKGLLELLELFKNIPKSKDLFAAGSAIAEACLFLPKMAVDLGISCGLGSPCKIFYLEPTVQ